MAHVSHKMNAYRDGNGWVEYCQLCSSEMKADLEAECPGKYAFKPAKGFAWVGGKYVCVRDYHVDKDHETKLGYEY